MRIRKDWKKLYPQWDDWRWQMRSRVTDAEGLEAWMPVPEALKEEIREGTRFFRMAATPYYLSLMDPDDPDDPIRRQCVVSAEELKPDPNGADDPLNETGSSVRPHIIHRYPDRVLLLATMECAMYCRHCTRRRIVGEEDRSVPPEVLDRELDYVRSHPEIRDVLVSGGDPLTLSTERLETVLAMLRAIPHVDIIRIGTRVPCVLPMRVDRELTDMLRRYHPLWINVQFNHPVELTPEAEEACRRLADAGIPLGNQSVLLKGVNDSAETMKALLLRLVHDRVRPYYLYQCDLSRGIGHFRTSVETGISLMHELQGSISGFAVPRYVIDAPGGGGKVPIQYDYVRQTDEEGILFENYQGRLYRYPNTGGGERKEEG